MKVDYLITNLKWKINNGKKYRFVLGKLKLKDLMSEHIGNKLIKNKSNNREQDKSKVKNRQDKFHDLNIDRLYINKFRVIVIDLIACRVCIQYGQICCYVIHTNGGRLQLKILHPFWTNGKTDTKIQLKNARKTYNFPYVFSGFFRLSICQK